MPIEEVVDDQSEEVIEDQFDNKKTEQPSSVHEQIEAEKEDAKESEISQLTSVRNDKHGSGDDLVLSKFLAAAEHKDIQKKNVIKDIQELKSPIMQLKCRMHDDNVTPQDFINKFLFSDDLKGVIIQLNQLEQKLKVYMKYSKPHEVTDLANFIKSKESSEKNIVSRSKLLEIFNDFVQYKPFSKGKLFLKINHFL